MTSNAASTLTADATQMTAEKQSFCFGAPPTFLGDAIFYYTIPPAICQEKNQKNFNKIIFPKLCDLTIDFCGQMCYNLHKEVR